MNPEKWTFSLSTDNLYTSNEYKISDGYGGKYTSKKITLVIPDELEGPVEKARTERYYPNVQAYIIEKVRQGVIRDLKKSGDSGDDPEPSEGTSNL